MYDYKLSKSSHVSGPEFKGGFGEKFKLLLVWLLGGTFVVAVVIWLALRFVIPSLLPLPDNQSLVVISPDNTKSPTVFFFNTHEQSLAVLTLATDEYQRLSPEPKTQLFLSLGRVFDQVLIQELPAVSTPNQALQFLQNSVFEKGSDLSFNQRLRWWLFAQSLPANSVQVKEISSVQSWKQFVQTTAQKQPLRRCTIGVINTTQTPGLSKTVSSILEQTGYQVVKVDSSNENAEKSYLRFAEGKTECREYGQTIVNGLLPQASIESSAEVLNTYRADIVVFLGQDMASLVTMPTP